MANHPHDSSRPESRAVKKALAADDIEALKLALTYRQRRFCEELVIDFNASAAAVRAGYSPKGADKQAHLLKMNKGVIRYIEHLTQSAAAKVMSVDPDYIIQGIVQIIGKEGGRDGDKLRGYELLAKILGMLKERQEITGKDGGPVEIEQRTREEADSFTNLIKSLRKKEEKKEVTVV